MVALCALVALSCRAACDELLCGPPEEPEYSCTPVAPGTPDTCGGPIFEGEKYDQDKAFPIGCTVRLPTCVSAHASSVQTCDCQVLGDTPRWSCPI